MAVMLLQLSLFVLTIVKMTSSQSTEYDVTQQESDVITCGRTEQVLIGLVTAVLQLQQKVGELRALIENKGASRNHNDRSQKQLSSFRLQ